MVVLIDVRTREEYTVHHASDARHLPLDEILAGKVGFLSEVDKNDRLELYCRSGGRSEMARKALVALGFLNVVNRGGLRDVESGSSLLAGERYWFRPARFWKWFACYYPASRRGWAVTLMLLGLAGALFVFVESRSLSMSDTLIDFAPWAIALMAVFDMLCFRHGEYPSWWRQGSTSQK